MAATRTVTRPRSRLFLRGFTLVELMVGLALGLLVLLAVTTVFINVSSNRHDMEKTGRQIENGRYAMQLLQDDIANAGYFGEFDPRDVGAPPAKPDPCSTNVADLKAAILMHVQGYFAATKPSCVTDVRTGTAILAIRRLQTCIAGDPNCDPATAGEIYMQSTLCNDEIANPLVSTHYAVAAQGSPLFNLHKRGTDCTTATAASLRKYVMHIYFIANNNSANDGIPTLKRVELSSGGLTILPLVEGIENLGLEYLLDTNGDGVPDAVTASPGAYNGCASESDPCYRDNWINTVAVKVHILSRATELSPGYTDNKTYPFGLQADDTPLVLVPNVNDGFKRHAYSAMVRMNNPAGRRE